MGERGGGGFTQGTLSRACKSDYFAGRPIVPAILSVPVAYTYMYMYMCIHIPVRNPYTLPPADNYSGQLDIPRAYKHARTHASVPIPSPSSRCSANPIFDYATMRSLDRQ